MLTKVINTPILENPHKIWFFALITLTLQKNIKSMNVISDTIKYIGVDDLDIDLFESQYVVPEGMSYNSYLIDDEKIAVMDTADRRKGEQWKANLTAALNGRQPDYLVAHHMEPDHAALIAWMLETYPGLQLVCSAQAVKMLPNFFEGFNFEGRVITVKEGDTLELGHHTLHFITAAMVHWPEVIMSYDDKDKVLFSADGFGKFGALSKGEGEMVNVQCSMKLSTGPARRVVTTLISVASMVRRCRAFSKRQQQSTFRPSVRCMDLCLKARHWLRL